MKYGSWSTAAPGRRCSVAILRCFATILGFGFAMQAKLALNGGFVRHMEPDEVATFVQNEQKTWRPIMEQVAKEATK